MVTSEFNGRNATSCTRRRMSERRFYLLAALLPIAVTLSATLVAAWQSRNGPSPVGTIGGGAIFLEFIGVDSTAPVLILLLVVWTRFRHAEGRVLRRIALVAPLIIAAIFAPVFGWGTGWSDLRSFLMGAAFGGAWALVIGYAYVQRSKFFARSGSGQAGSCVRPRPRTDTAYTSGPV